MTDDAGLLKDDDRGGTNWMVETCGLHGQLAVILAWHIDGTDEDGEPFAEIREMQSALELIPPLLTGDTADFQSGDWWLLFDALGSFPYRTAELQELYEICQMGNAGTLPSGGTTKAFTDADGNPPEVTDGNGHA